jgi:hypothetical protein
MNCSCGLRVANFSERASLERAMSDLESPAVLRDKLIARRRTLAPSLLGAAPEQVIGDPISRIQSAIEAIESAVKEENQVASRERWSGGGSSQVSKKGEANECSSNCAFDSIARGGPSERRACARI